MRHMITLRRALADIKPEAEQLDGKIFDFQQGWVMDAADTSIYIGETAMIPTRGQDWPENAPSWIASGDMQLMPPESVI